MKKTTIGNMYWNGVLKPRNPIAKEIKENKQFRTKIKKDKKKFDRAKRRDYFRDSLE